MDVSPYGEALVKRFEACILHPYLDAVNLWTIGWGRRITLPDVKLYWKGITQAQADEWFDQDIQTFAKGVSKVVMKPLEQNEFDAVVCISYNIGLGAFGSSTLLHLINEGKKAEAAAQF